MFFQQLSAFVIYFTRISYHDSNNSILIHRLIFICLWSKTFFLIMWFRKPHIQYPSFTILMEFNIGYFSICKQVIISSSHQNRNSFALNSINNCINNSIMPAYQESAISWTTNWMLIVHFWLVAQNTVCFKHTLLRVYNTLYIYHIWV